MKNLVKVRTLFSNVAWSCYPLVPQGMGQELGKCLQELGLEVKEVDLG